MNMQMFQVGDIVTCINCAEEHGIYNPVTHQYKVPIPDCYQLLTLGVDYTVSSILKQIHNVFIIDMITLEEFPNKEFDDFTLFTKQIFNADRFEINIKETRKKKIKSLE
jgi:hypothetical protein